MGPRRSRGPWEWECRQPGGVAREAETWCPRSFVGDSASKPGVKLSWKSTSPETQHLGSSALSSAPLRAGSTEGVAVSEPAPWGLPSMPPAHSPFHSPRGGSGEQVHDGRGRTSINGVSTCCVPGAVQMISSITTLISFPAPLCPPTRGEPSFPSLDKDKDTRPRSEGTCPKL